MGKIRGPLLSLEAHGWLGRYTYARIKAVPNPYPIALLGRVHIPYSLWDRQIFGVYHVPAFGLIPYPGFISRYYSPIGWCYQQRRTWHGLQPVFERPYITANPRTRDQEAWRQDLSEGMYKWASLSPDEKAKYKKYVYPVHATDFNRFLHEYLRIMKKEYKKWADPLASWSDSTGRWAGMRVANWADSHVKWSSPLYTWAL
jgi:hypothetical protein